MESENSVLITLFDTWIKPHLKLELLGFQMNKPYLSQVSNVLHLRLPVLAEAWPSLTFLTQVP